MVGASVALSVSGPGSVPSTVTTDGDGLATATFTAGPSATSAEATVTATLGDATDSLGVHVKVPVAVSVNPAGAALTAGQSTQFTATVSGTPNTAVTWTATGGAITQAGLYTAGPTGGTFSVTATSVADPTASRTVPVSVQGARILSGSVTQAFTAPGGIPIGGFSGFVRVAVRLDGSVVVLDASGGSTAIGLSDCGTNTIVATLDGSGRYLPAPNAYDTRLDVLELSGSETRTFTFVDENGECQSSTTTEAGIDTAEVLYARKVIANGQVVAITLELEPPFDHQTGQLLPE
jgi:hypothetical protein